MLGVSTNEVKIRNLSLTLEHVAKSAAKVIATQQKSLDSLAKFILGNRIAFDYLLAKQSVYAVVKIIAALALALTEKLKLSYIRSLNKTVGLKRSFFDLFDFDGLSLEDHGSKVHSKHWGLSCL